MTIGVKTTTLSERLPMALTAPLTVDGSMVPAVLRAGIRGSGASRAAIPQFSTAPAGSPAFPRRGGPRARLPSAEPPGPGLALRLPVIRPSSSQMT